MFVKDDTKGKMCICAKIIALNHLITGRFEKNVKRFLLSKKVEEKHSTDVKISDKIWSTCYTEYISRALFVIKSGKKGKGNVHKNS